ncbi:MAG: DUF1330 domain-containing protein [Candidatus Tectomicrobia bacterium]|uniref:DUF1330 domain-containing protein n=1 Tax=Tectimicrobiota bacterium TaxID=2528274 RepID=A0A932HVH3_UNCTE|nr:DUF1330 domain-containing protein [Candidatus Tectomicrobia bacterium]
MSACVVVHVEVKDPEKFKEYSAKAPATVAAHKGEFIVRGRVAEVFCGEHDRKQAVAIRFPSVEAARAWYRSPEYQALIPNRDAAAEMTFICLEEAAPPSR